MQVLPFSLTVLIRFLRFPSSFTYFHPLPSMFVSLCTDIAIDSIKVVLSIVWMLIKLNGKWKMET